MPFATPGDFRRSRIVAKFLGQNQIMKAVKVSVGDAKNNLPALIKRAESGERITICRHGEPVADLVRTEAAAKKPLKLGTLAGKGPEWEIDPDWWKPMTEEETEAFLEGRY